MDIIAGCLPVETGLSPVARANFHILKGILMQYAHDRIQKVYQQYRQYMEDTTYKSHTDNRYHHQENFRFDLALYDLNILALEISHLCKRGYFTSFEQRNYSNVLHDIEFIAKKMMDGGVLSPTISLLEEMAERRRVLNFQTKTNVS